MMALRRRHRQAEARKELNPPALEEGTEDGVKASWIELNFRKRECIKFVPSYGHDGFQRCGCGRLLSEHNYLDNYEKSKDLLTVDMQKPRFELENETTLLSIDAASSSFHYLTYNLQTPTSICQDSSISSACQHKEKRKSSPSSDYKWNVLQHTSSLPTDAHGILEYQGTGEGDKSQYIRLAHDTHPELILKLLTEEWGLQLPKMVITVHGGVHNFQLQPKLRRVFCDGLIKAAKTTGAWIMMFGLNTGVGSIVGNALKEHKAKSRGKIYSIGVAPWGVVDNRDDLVGPQVISSYQTMANPLSKGAVLHAAHTHFLLVDNGTTGKYDSELKFRRKLERKLSLQQINTKHSRKIPVVCLVLEGGKNTINVVLESVRQTPPIPVIVVDGSGRAADLIAFAHQYADDDGTMMEELRVQLLVTIQNTFSCEREQAQYIFLTIMECVRRKDLITVFRLRQGQNKQDDIDNAILTASLKARRTSAPDMLSLALTWNRIDIATSQIFVYGQHWPVLSLEQAMMDALTQDRVDFVKLLMENGVSMHKFLTIPRLEELYNIKQIPVHLLYLLQDVKKSITLHCRFNLIEIGQVIESLMGGAYRCNYTRKRFRQYYASQGKNNVKRQPSFSKSILPVNLSKLDVTSSFREFSVTASPSAKLEPNHTSNPSPQCQIPKDFQYPFHELMVWAVLMKRQKMALFMWQHGEEAIAKALVAAKLYRTMAKEAADDELDLEEMEELRKYSSEFRILATQLLEICYRADTVATQHLLTYELKQWSRHTCLSLAIAAQHRDFIAHPCVQLLLNDLWMGGLNVRKNSSLRVILGILVPPSLFMLQFKSQEELQLMPQTMEEHMDERNDSMSLSSSSSSSLASSTSSSSSSSNTSGSITSGLQHKPEVVGRGAAGLHPSNQLPQDAYSVFMAQQQQLSMSKKLYEFYNAPITKFWLYTLSYNAFLITFTYVILVSMDLMPSVMEWLVIAHTFTLALEKTREVAASEPSGAFHKIKIWMSHFWHQVDIVLFVMFFIGFTLRMMQDPHLLKIGRAFYCVNIALWYIRLLNIFSVSKYLGPYVMMMGKMMVDLGTFIIILAVVLLSFGVTRQALLHPTEDASWSLVRDVLLEPYFMLYGEVYAGRIDPCNGDDKTLCVVGSWIVPTAMTLYLLVANILLLNMLIAVFNNTFTKVKNISDQIWKFHRYGMILEYESRPVFPPPLILISYLFMLVRLCFKKRKNSIFNSDRGLKLFLDDEDVEKLHDFEEECVDDFFRQKDVKTQESSDVNVRNVSPERMERFLDYIDDAGDRDHALTSHIQLLEERLSQLEEANMRMLQIVPNLTNTKQNNSAVSDSEEYSGDQASERLDALQQQMHFRLRRMRQDSEMSDWHPPNLLFRRFKNQTSVRERHASEQTAHGNSHEYKIRKTHSAGNISNNNPDAVVSSATLVTASSHNSGSCHALSKLLVDQEQKSVSCQDILLMNNDLRKACPSKIFSPVADNDILSGSEFLPSDYNEEPSPDHFKDLSSWPNATVENLNQKIGPTDKREAKSDGAEATMQNLKPAEDTRNVRDGDRSSGHETCCSSDEHPGRKRKSKQRKKKRSSQLANIEKNSPSPMRNISTMPTFVINSPESERSFEQIHGLTPVDDASPTVPSKILGPRLRRGLNTFPHLNIDSSLPLTSDTVRSRTSGTSFNFNACYSGEVGVRGSGFRPAFTPPRIHIRTPSNFNAPQSMYKSITDCIDTSRWHDANTPNPPTTPFESWVTKPPDFAMSRQARSPLFSIEGSSQDEWEDENLSLRRSGKRSTASRGSKRRGQRRHRRSRVHSNNSSSSIKSNSSRHGRGTVRKHRHRHKKKLQKSPDETDALQAKNSDCVIPLRTLPEASPTPAQQKDPASCKPASPHGSAGVFVNFNNCNIEFNGRETDPRESDESSFIARYASGPGKSCFLDSKKNPKPTIFDESKKEDNNDNLLLGCDNEKAQESRPLLC